MKHT
jgi:dynein intermediate chain 2